MTEADATALLTVEELCAGYGRVQVLDHLSLDVKPGEVTAIVGSNGAGKSTLLKTLSGLIRPMHGRILYRGEDLAGRRPHEFVRRGVLHVAEGRRLFRTQTVEENLQLGLFGCKFPADEVASRRERVFALFPELADRLERRAGDISGGQQQMLAIGQALLRDPQLLLLDEPSLGLAPLLIDRVLDAVCRLRDEGTTVVLVEQVVERALEISEHAFVVQHGRVVAQGSASSLAGSDEVRNAYLGTSGVTSEAGSGVTRL